MPNRNGTNRHDSGDSKEAGDDNNNVIGNLNSTKCCVPNGCHSEKLIQMQDLNDCVKVICNNDQCNQGKYMHKECFEAWEENVLTFLRTTGRARSWSEKQRSQNLWTKKGYDLAYKACGCKCGKGHLRKDLDWIAPASTRFEDSSRKKKNRKKKSNDKPSLTISTTMLPINSSNNNNSNNNNNNNNNNNKHHCNGNSNNNNGSALPITRFRTSSISSTGSGGSGGISPPLLGSSDSASSGFLDSNSFVKKILLDTKRERHSSGSIFLRRQDFSSFNKLPQHKINSYHIKMEDDVNHGNDETRCFILTTLSANRVNRISCILCHGNLIVFDRYPLIDGSFFLSPLQHSKSSIPCQVDCRRQYLNAICMGCLEGWNVSLKCKNCSNKWSGSHLILGSMYSYDIFAAVPCCFNRLRCKNCLNLAISPESRLYFSDYSHSLACTHCGIVDYHFAKQINDIFIRGER